MNPAYEFIFRSLFIGAGATAVMDLWAALLLLAAGLEWGRHPTLLPALALGVGTVFAPLLILQPALGAGIASRKTPRPLFNSLKSLVTHLVFGFGLYLAATLLILVYHPTP